MSIWGLCRRRGRGFLIGFLDVRNGNFIIFERLNRLDYEPFDSKEHRPDKGS